eukprot:Tbor_TRINITY_DN4689_c0_g2::TRINITY_DN4689_c0_g2_i1::g.14968::m.14968
MMLSSFDGTKEDTKSIVLALQALQEKIRKLEEDRDFHRQECERAHIAHEAYKREVEDQLERERIEHRRREDELYNLIAKASAENSAMADSVEQSQMELSTFRDQLDSILEKERASFNERERELKQELEQHRSCYLEERSLHERLDQSLAQHEAEKKVLLSTNKRLEATVADLIEMNSRMLGTVGINGGTKNTKNTNYNNNITGKSKHIMTRRQMNIKPVNHYNTSLNGHHDPNQSITSTGSRRRSTSYRDATASSEAKGIVRSTPLPSRAPSRERPRSISRQDTEGAKDQRHAALGDVYNALEKEHEILLEQYKKELQSGDSMSVNAVLKKLDAKSEQLRVFRHTMAETEAKGEHIKEIRGMYGGKEPRSISPRGAIKAAQRGAIVNQIRGLFTNKS